jgi:hypothetical protein
VALKLLDASGTELGDGTGGEGPGLGLGFNVCRDPSAVIDGVVREGLCIVHAAAEDFAAHSIFGTNGKGAALGVRHVLVEGAVCAAQGESGEGGTDGKRHWGSFRMMGMEPFDHALVVARVVQKRGLTRCLSWWHQVLETGMRQMARTRYHFLWRLH